MVYVWLVMQEKLYTFGKHSCGIIHVLSTNHGPVDLGRFLPLVETGRRSASRS